MSLRVVWRFFIPILLCAFFWKPLSLTGIGALVRWYLQAQKGWHLEYSSLHWTQQGIVFTDLALTDATGCSLHSKRVQASLLRKFLKVEQPHLFLTPTLQWPEESEWTVVLRDGTVEGEGMDPASFSLESDPTAHHLQIRWETGGDIALDAHPTDRGLALDIALNQVDPHSVRRWIGDCGSARLQGRVHVVVKEGLFDQWKGHLDIQGGQYQNLCDGVQGVLDWDLEHSGHGHLRLSIAQGTLCLKHCSLQNIQGALSYSSETGGKWEWGGRLHGEPLHWEGRFFLNSLQGRWLETTLRCKEAFFTLSGREENTQRVWEGKWTSLGPDLVQWLQDVLQLYTSKESVWSLANGTCSGTAHLTESEGQILHWEIPEFYGEQLFFQHPLFSFGCETLQLHQEIYSLSGGAFSLFLPDRDPVTGSNWAGEWNAIDEKASLSGHFAGCDVSCSLLGKVNDFQAHALAQGPWKSAVDVRGGWDGEALHLFLTDAHINEVQFTGQFSLNKDLSFFGQSHQFSGSLSSIFHILHKENPLQGRIASIGNGLSIQGSWSQPLDWSLQAKITEGQMPLFASARLEDLSMELGADAKGFACYNTKGTFSWGEKFSFCCPIFETQGRFDVRLEGKTWDFFRLAGQFCEGEGILDTEKSHLLGARFSQGRCHIGEEKLQHLHLVCPIPGQIIASLLHIPNHLNEGATLTVSFDSALGAKIEVVGAGLQWDDAPFDLACCFEQEEGRRWRLHPSQLGDFSLEGVFLLNTSGISLLEGKGKWKEGLEFSGEGQFESLQQWGAQFSHVRLDLDEIAPLTSRFNWPLEQIEGILEGTGTLHWKGHFEADLHFAASCLKAGSLLLKNQTPLHLHYSSAKGILFQGLDLGVWKEDFPQNPSWFDCKIDLLQYDATQALWRLTHADCHLSPDFFAALQSRIPSLQHMILPAPLDVVANIECSSDFSSLSCSIPEGSIPWQGEVKQIQNLHLFTHPTFCTATFDLLHQGQWLNMHLAIDLKSTLSGRLSIQNALFIDWAYEDRWVVQAIEGVLAGMELSFHQEKGDTLIGSARIDFNAVSEVIPPRIAEVFRDLKMGKGYELMGRMRIDREGVFFNGILSGKQFELFNYQLKTLLAQVEITPTQVRIYDLKISDLAGQMKVDEILIAEKRGAPWTLSIPHLTIFELRPSLIQKIGKPPGTISPLVVREFTLDGLRGNLEEGKTYLAKGELHFINSYKREHTVFDIPSDVLSRIVGIDLDLLIPVCGTLRYELKNGAFRLTELKGAYSENKRSEFFLVQSEQHCPQMDLDGSLNILITMKHFVLFTLTESLVISIDGTLDDPSFHLQKRKNFLGL